MSRRETSIKVELPKLPKAELVRLQVWKNDRSVTTVAERRLVVHKRRAQPVATIVHGCCLLVGDMSWSGPQMRSPRLRLFPIDERLACERAIIPSLLHLGEVAGARPDYATAVVFRARTSCRLVFPSVHNISVRYESSVRDPIVLYIPTPQRVLGRRVVIMAARSMSVPHRRGGGFRRVVVRVIPCTTQQRRTCGALQLCTILI